MSKFKKAFTPTHLTYNLFLFAKRFCLSQHIDCQIWCTRGNIRIYLIALRGNSIKSRSTIKYWERAFSISSDCTLKANDKDGLYCCFFKIGSHYVSLTVSVLTVKMRLASVSWGSLTTAFQVLLLKACTTMHDMKEYFSCSSPLFHVVYFK